MGPPYSCSFELIKHCDAPLIVLNAVAICITMQSMLASNKKKERSVSPLHPVSCADGLSRPEGNDRYVRTAPSNPKLTRWHYDDDVRGFCPVEKGMLMAVTDCMISTQSMSSASMMDNAVLLSCRVKSSWRA